VPAAIHLSPEAAAGGPIAKIRSGDMILLDAELGILRCEIDAAEFDVRETARLDLGGDHRLRRVDHLAGQLDAAVDRSRMHEDLARVQAPAVDLVLGGVLAQRRHEGLVHALVLHPQRDSAPALDTILQWAGNHGASVLGLADDIARIDCNAIPVDPETLAAKSNILVSLGGDGTMLRSMRLAAYTKTGVLGVNLGHVGFLAEAEVDEERKRKEMPQKRIDKYKEK